MIQPINAFPLFAPRAVDKSEAGSFVPGGCEWVETKADLRSLLSRPHRCGPKRFPNPPKHPPFPSLIRCRPRVPVQHPRGLRVALETGASLSRPPHRRTRRRPPWVPLSSWCHQYSRASIPRAPHVSFGFDWPGYVSGRRGRCRQYGRDRCRSAGSFSSLSPPRPHRLYPVAGLPGSRLDDKEMALNPKMATNCHD